MLYDVVVKTWIETDRVYRDSYHQALSVKATSLTEEKAHELAEELVDEWCVCESEPYKRFITGPDHGAYVDTEDRAWGVRVTVLPHR